MTDLQWGGRFAAPPNATLLAFGSSLEEDLGLAPFDVVCSTAHVSALLGGGIIDRDDAQRLTNALATVANEIETGTFAARARAAGAEDVHGAIDARVREIAGTPGERLHAGRSRNDQVATTLLLYARDRAEAGASITQAIAATIVRRAREEFQAGTILAGCTHRQPAQPVLLAFVLVAWAEAFVRAARRFVEIERATRASCPLGSGALAGSTLPLDRETAAATLGFERPSRNAFDAISNRDVLLDLAHAYVRTLVDASRICEELIAWSTPAYGYVHLDDSASTGSSLMPQKRNPDPFELIRARAATMTGAYAGALASLCGLAPSYQRDLQETKASAMSIVERSHAALVAFDKAFVATSFERERMSATASIGYTIATDVADALISHGATARAAHAYVGGAVATAERQGRPLDASDLTSFVAERGIERFDAPLTAQASVRAKRTIGSTAPDEVERQIDALVDELVSLERFG
jgi:argininosuccinate lyase